MMKKLVFAVGLPVLLSACGTGESVQIVESCRIEGPLNGAQLAFNEEFKIVGWAFDKATGSSPEQINIELFGNEHKSFTATRFSRPDVVKALNTPGAEMSGFVATVPANSLVADHYEIVIVQKTAEHKIECLPNFMLDVK